MLLFPPNFDELLLCVSLHLALEGRKGGGVANVHLRIPEQTRWERFENTRNQLRGS